MLSPWKLAQADRLITIVCVVQRPGGSIWVRTDSSLAAGLLARDTTFLCGLNFAVQTECLGFLFDVLSPSSGFCFSWA